MNWQKKHKSYDGVGSVIKAEYRKLGWLHIIIWVGYSFVLFYGPNLIFDSGTALIMTLRTLVINAFIFYVNILVLLPLLVGRSRFMAYGIAIFILLGSVSFLWNVTDPVDKEDWERMIINQSEVMDIATPQGERMKEIVPLKQNGRIPERRDLNRPPTPPGEFIGRHTVFSLLSSLGILFLSTMFWVMVDARRKEKERFSLTNENLETEMKFLKSQMNPHFLFNALNNIYSLAQRQSPKTPKLILMLSSMLRFIVYETDTHKIPLSMEIDYIENFVEFQKIKLEDSPLLDIDMEKVDSETKIEPMLFFPFVENAFKHGNIDDTVNGWIRMKLESGTGRIHFFCANSKPIAEISKDKVGGIGIENVKKRLSFLYKGRHQIEINDLEDRFEVNLEIVVS
ncbi:sensor histidine kinase [Marinilabilia sp.]|uniref:sensor histidine kinase n=1 Tax=Marinilabilia sp. TaxID=2021252 RepID=UPI0025BBE2FB|nr:sensor histidine kinase [Marinilabilia sp.]